MLHLRLFSFPMSIHQFIPAAQPSQEHPLPELLGGWPQHCFCCSWVNGFNLLCGPDRQGFVLATQLPGTGWEHGSLGPLLILLLSLSSLANNKTYNLLIAIQTQQRVYMICSNNQMVLNKTLIKQRQMAFNKGSYKPVWEP